MSVLTERIAELVLRGCVTPPAMLNTYQNEIYHPPDYAPVIEFLAVPVITGINDAHMAVLDEDPVSFSTGRDLLILFRRVLPCYYFDGSRRCVGLTLFSMTVFTQAFEGTASAENRRGPRGMYATFDTTIPTIPDRRIIEPG